MVADGLNGDRLKDRQRAVVLFWISLVVFAASLIYVVVRYAQISTWRRGGMEGLAVVVEAQAAFTLSALGMFFSVVICSMSIAHFRGALVLLAVEVIILLLLILAAR